MGFCWESDSTSFLWLPLLIRLYLCSCFSRTVRPLHQQRQLLSGVPRQCHDRRSSSVWHSQPGRWTPTEQSPLPYSVLSNIIYVIFNLSHQPFLLSSHFLVVIQYCNTCYILYMAEALCLLLIKLYCIEFIVCHSRKEPKEMYIVLWDSVLTILTASVAYHQSLMLTIFWSSASLTSVCMCLPASG